MFCFRTNTTKKLNRKTNRFTWKFSSVFMSQLSFSVLFAFVVCKILPQSRIKIELEEKKNVFLIYFRNEKHFHCLILLSGFSLFLHGAQSLLSVPTVDFSEKSLKNCWENYREILLSSDQKLKEFSVFLQFGNFIFVPKIRRKFCVVSTRRQKSESDKKNFLQKAINC